MAYGPIESSTDQGLPVYLYEFVLNDVSWYYSTAASDRLILGKQYRGTPISDEGIRVSGDISADMLTINAPVSIGPAQAFMGSPPSSPMFLRIRRMHEGDTEAPLVYAGEIVQVGYPEPGRAEIKALPLASLTQREGLRLTWQRTCPYGLYDPATCKVNKADHAIPGTLTEVTGVTVKSEAFLSVPSGTLRGGFIEWVSLTRGTEYRGINDHVGDTVTIFGFTDGLYYGLPIVAYPGCDLTVAMCRDRFDNLNNYGGIPHLQGSSPFDGNPIF